MSALFEDNRFVFSEPDVVLKAIDVLVDRGVRSSRLSIHLWRGEFAVRVQDRVGQDIVDAMTAMGGALHMGQIGPQGRSVVVSPSRDRVARTQSTAAGG